MNENKKQKKGLSYNDLFFLGVVLVYVLFYVFKPQATVKAVENCAVLIIRIIPVLVLVIFFMGVMNYFVNPKQLQG